MTRITLFFICTILALTSGIEQNLKIVNGSSVSSSRYASDFPFVAQVPGCTGSLVERRYILTAAHCSSLNTGGTVYIGSNTRSRGTRYTIQSVARHPNWSAGASNRRAWDLAVLRLDRNCETHNGVRLWGIHSSTDRTQEGRTTTHVGWGRTDPDVSSSTVTTLQWTTGNMARNSSSRVGQLITRGARTCSGDSGGPLIIGSNGDVVYGALSGGSSGCGSTAYYSPTQPSASWLRSQLGLRADAPPKWDATLDDMENYHAPASMADCLDDRQQEATRELLAAVRTAWKDAANTMWTYLEGHDDDDTAQAVWESIEDVSFQVDDLEEQVNEILSLDCSSCAVLHSIVDRHIDATAVQMSEFIDPNWESTYPYSSVVDLVSAMKAILSVC